MSNTDVGLVNYSNAELEGLLSLEERQMLRVWIEHEREELGREPEGRRLLTQIESATRAQLERMVEGSEHARAELKRRREV